MHVYMYDNIIYMWCFFSAVAPKGIIFSRSCKEKSFVQKNAVVNTVPQKKVVLSENIFFEQKADI